MKSEHTKVTIEVKAPGTAGGKPWLSIIPSKPTLYRVSKDTIEWTCADGDFTIVFKKDEADSKAQAQPGEEPPFAWKVKSAKKGGTIGAQVRENGVCGTYKYAVVVATSSGQVTKDPEVIVDDSPPGGPINP